MTTNVRFYRLDELPSFIVNKHKGIFVHVTKTMYKDGGSIERPNPKDPTNLLMTPGKDGGSVERINFVQWLTERNIDKIASGLWFGGENGWELLSNETNSAAINAAINAKIQELHVDGYAQATISGSTLTISGIREDNGKIAKDTNNNLVIAIDGTYNESTNKIATESTVKTAIEALDVNTAVQAVTTASAEGNTDNTVLTFKGVKEENGKILQGDGTTTFTVGDAKLKIQIGSAAAFDVFSANAQTNSTIKLDGLVFKKDGDEISVITPTPVASDNRLVTEKDVANLAGAMHYKGTVSSLTEFQNKLADSDAEEAGDVYIATGIQEGSFTHNGNTIENGDMIVFNSASEYKVVQSNITLGTGDGQIAANVGALADGNMVIATSGGIKTIGITETQLTGADNNKRELSYRNGTADTDTINNITLYHDVTISDAFQVIGKDFTKTINISSNNRSIEISKKTVGGVDTGVMVDLVWNTSMEQ